MNSFSKSFARLTKFALVVVLCGLASAANVNTLSSAATGSSLVLLLKNATDSTYFYAELGKTVSDLRTMAELQSDTPEKYSVLGDGVTGPLNEASIQSLNGYTNSNLAAYLAGNTSDAITWTIMGSKSAPSATAGAAAFAVTSNVNFMDTENFTGLWENQAAWTAANFFGNNFITDELNAGAWTNGQSTVNGWGSGTANGVNAPVSFNGAGFENGAALGVSQPMYLLVTTGGDAANVYKSVATLTLGADGVLSVTGGQPSSYTVSGTVSGLGAGKSVVLQNNSGDDQTVTHPASGFSFSAQNDGSGYSVTVATQPVGQTCLVSNATGTLAGADVNNVAVTCTDLTYTVSGSISGLSAPGLSLSLSGSKSDAVSPASGTTSYAFTQTVVNGESYTVTIGAQPTGQTCTLSPNPATGTVGTTNVVVNVTCILNTYTISGTNTNGASVSISGSSIGGQAGTTANPYNFTAKSGDTVTLTASKTGYTCSVANSPILVFATDVTNADVSCTPITYTISGTTDGATVTASGSTVSNTVTTVISSYSLSAKYGDVVTLTATKTGYTCSVAGSPITVGAANVTTANVSCTLNKYTVGGTNTDGASVTISGSSISGQAATTANPYSFNAKYGDVVKLAATKTGYTCSVANSPILVFATDVTNADVSCTANTYTISGTTDGATVVASGSTLSNTVTTGISIYSLSAKYGDVVTLTATKLGYSGCVIDSSPITVSGDTTANVSGCTANTYTITVTNTPAASVSITGSTATNATNPNSASSFTFSAKYGDNVTLAATKESNVCTASPSAINFVEGDTTATVNCSTNTYTVSGTVSGLGAGKSVVLQNNGTNNQTVANPAFTFSFPAQADGSGYNVNVLTQPVGQTCLVTNGSGTLASADLLIVVVTCSNNTYSIGGSVSGLLAGQSVVLANGADSKSVSSNGSFTFSTLVNYGDAYSVTVATQPSAQTCVVSNGSGTATANVTNVGVVCTPNTYTISGTTDGATVTASGSTASSGNTVNTNAGVYSLSARYGDVVTLSATKTGYTCTVAGSPITVPASDVTTANVICTAKTYTIAVTNSSAAAVTITGSTATNATNPNSATSFNFSAKHGDAVVLSASKTGNNCTVATIPASINPIIGNATATVSCTLITYTVGGTNTAGASVSISGTTLTGQADTTANPYSFNAEYGEVVTLTATKAGYTCTVAGSPITVGISNVSTANVSCTQNTYSIGGTVSGLSGSVTLMLNNTEQKIITSNRGFRFSTQIPYQGSYEVKIVGQPIGGTCSITNSSGSVDLSNISNVVVTCSYNSSSSSSSSASSSSNSSVASSSSSAASSSVASSVSSSSSSNASSYSSSSSGAVSSSSSLSSAASSSSSSAPTTFIISGTVSGLGAGKSVVLQNNGANNQTVTNTASGFSFPAQLNGSGYNVTVLTQPVGQTCSLLNNSGTLAGANVTNVAVTCTLNSYMVGGANVDGASVTIIGSSISGQLATSDNPYSFTAKSTDMVTLIATKAGYTCTVAGSPITVGISNVSTANVSCTQNTYSIGGTVSGLSGSVTLMLNNTEQKIITSNRGFRFSTQIPYQGSYEVKIVGQPIGQTCSITNSSGSVDLSNISNVVVTCSYVDAQSRDASGGGVMDQRWLMLLALIGIAKNRRKHIEKTP